MPNVYIVEEEFDFGGITTLGNIGTLGMTLINDGNIEATLILDLRERLEDEGIECLDV